MDTQMAPQLDMPFPLSLNIYLNSSLGQPQSLTEFLSHEGVRIMRLVKQPLQFVQLFQREVGSATALLQFRVRRFVFFGGDDDVGRQKRRRRRILDDARRRFRTNFIRRRKSIFVFPIRYKTNDENKYYYYN